MSREARIALASVLLLALGVRIALFTGLQVGDDIVYSRIAMDRLEGRVQFGNIHETRLGYLLPVTASYALFGAGEVPLVLYNLLCSVGLAGTAFLLARRFFGDRAGAIAGALAALHPTLVTFATEAHTDTPVALWQALALLAALSSTGLRPLVLAGSLIAWGYLHKETALFLLPVLLGIARRRSWALLLPIAGTVGAELLFYGLFTGRPFHRVELVRYWHAGQYMVEHYPTTAAVLDRLFLDLPRQLFTPTWGGRWHGTVNLLGLAAGACLVARRVPGARLLGAWGLTLYALYCLWPSSWVPFRPGFALFEWTFPVLLPPLLVLLAGALARLRPGAAAAAVPAVAALCLLSAHAARTDARRFAEGAREARAWIGRERPARVVTDDKTAEALDFLEGHRPPVRIEVWGRPEGAAVVVDKLWTEEGRWWSRPAPPEARRPPWPPVYQSARLSIFRP